MIFVANVRQCPTYCGMETRITFRLDAATILAARRAAAKDGRTLSGWLRVVIATAIARASGRVKS